MQLLHVNSFAISEELLASFYITFLLLPEIINFQPKIK